MTCQMESCGFKSGRKREPAAESDDARDCNGCRVQSSDQALGCEKGNPGYSSFIHQWPLSCHVTLKQSSKPCRPKVCSIVVVLCGWKALHVAYLSLPAESVSVENDE